jgi:tetratricopeptide (TPR) repeat protein
MRVTRPVTARLLELGRGHGVAVLALMLLLALTFGGRLRGEFVWDDVPLVQNNPALVEPGGLRVLLTRDLWGSAGQASTQLYHPLPMLTFWLQAKLHGLSLPWLRLVNVLLHAACTLSLLAVMRRCQLPQPSTWLACLIFLLHPLVTEPVMWLTGRHDTLAALLTLLALLAFPKPFAPRRGLRLLASSLCCAGAFASKEPYVVAPVLVAAFSLLERAPDESWWRLLASWLGPFAGVLAVLLLRRALGIPSGSDQLGASLTAHLLSYAGIVQHYALLSLSLDQAATIATARPISSLSAALWLSGSGVALFLLWRARARREARVALLGVAWFLLALLPHVLSLPILGIWGNRYGYFPLMGLTLVLAAGLSLNESVRSGVVRGGVRLVVVASALMALLLTRQAAANFRDDLTLYGASVDAAPEDGRALYHLAHAVRKRRGCSGAVELLARAVELDPGYARAQRNLAGCLLELGQPRRALAPARRAVELEPRVASHHYNLGAALLGSGQRGPALAELERALELEPDHALARGLRARLVEPK